MIFLNILFLISVYVFNNPWLMVVLIYGCVPLMDYYIGFDMRNPTKEESKKMKNSFLHKIPLFLTILSDWISLVWGIHYVQTHNLNIFNKIGILFIMANFQGSSINLSHEIFHKPNLFENIVGTLNLSKNLYMHFFIEHNYGHHKMVATPNDPATSRLNETLYTFLPRTLYGGFASAWHIENERCLEKYKSKYCVYNRMIYFTLLYVLIPATVACVFSVETMAYFLFVSLTSILFLEVINYIEHYGLQRKETSPGVFENVTIHHSWNAPHRISNYLLFKLQRHSDHHENSFKPYQILCSYDESPALPQGYTVCILLSLFPKLWMEIMNPIVAAYKDGKKGPSKELSVEVNEKILKFIHNTLIYTSCLCAGQFAINLFF
jgi:alkane 1-monooxygenase